MSGSNLNTVGTITTQIETQDEFYHPRRSYLLVEGELIKAANSARYTAAADMHFVITESCICFRMRGMSLVDKKSKM